MNIADFKSTNFEKADCTSVLNGARFRSWKIYITKSTALTNTWTRTTNTETYHFLTKVLFRAI